MRIGKAQPAITSICEARADAIEVRGRDLVRDLMGKVTFTDHVHLLLTGRMPTDEQRFFLDLLLVAISEHGLVPTVQAARMTLAADPGSLQGALAAGILGAGPVILGTAELCADLLTDIRGRIDAGAEETAAVSDAINAVHSSGGKLPGFGHPVHKPADPRAERILELANERGVAGRHVALSLAVRDAAARAWGRPLVMNVSMPIAAVLLDLDFAPSMVKAIPLLARTASLLAHLAEERENPIGFAMAAEGEAAVTYVRRDG
jgi:citrate synthase